MDIFKLLSRSTKLSGSASKQSHSVPSSGQNGSPQLFGRNPGLATGTQAVAQENADERSILGKRKRKHHAIEAVPTELDFFSTATAQIGKPSKKSGKASMQDRDVKDVRNNFEDSHSEIMSMEERRRILHTHKIKITILDAAQARAGNTGRGVKDLEGKLKHSLCPNPLQSFSQLRPRYSISRRLAQNIEEQGYRVPTEIQLAALPLLMGGIHEQPTSDRATTCNLLAVAPTGSGKTLAFLIPIIDSILRERQADEMDQTRAIILAPTRELAHQIVNEGKKLLQNTGLRISLMRKTMKLAGVQEVLEANNDSDSEKGDISDDEDTRTKTSVSIVKAHIIVSTPLVLLNSIKSNGTESALKHIRHLVLDEADVLLDPLFRDQVEGVWSGCTNPDLRTSLWSATMPSSVEEFIMHQISVLGQASSVPTVRLVVGLKDSAVPNLTHTMTYTGSESGKLLALRQLLRPTAPDTDTQGRKALRPPFLVFTQTIERAKALQAELQYDIPPEAGGSARMAALHSEMSERTREAVMTGFRKGEIWVIITTDLLARGVDFRGLNGVVNYDVPTSAAAYVHRVGRTGRAGRQGGVAVTFYTKDDIPYVKPIANVIAASEKLRAEQGGSEVSISNMQQWLLDALPSTSKKDRKELKRRGVESRRSGEKSAKITTKSGYERKQDSRRRDRQHPKSEFKVALTATPRVQKSVSDSGEVFAGFSD